MLQYKVELNVFTIAHAHSYTFLVVYQRICKTEMGKGWVDKIVVDRLDFGCTFWIRLGLLDLE